MQGVQCSVCSEGGHHPLRCPELCDPLRPGFSGAGGGGGGGGGGDDDDERAFALAAPVPWLRLAVGLHTAFAVRLHTEQESTKSIHNAEDVVVDGIDPCSRRATRRRDRIVHQNL